MADTDPPLVVLPTYTNDELVIGLLAQSRTVSVPFDGDESAIPLVTQTLKFVLNAPENDVAESRFAVPCSLAFDVAQDPDICSVHVAEKFTKRLTKKGKKRRKTDIDYFDTCLVALQCGMEGKDVLGKLKLVSGVPRHSPRFSFFQMPPQLQVSVSDRGEISASVVFGAYTEPWQGNPNADMPLATHFNVVNVLRHFLELPPLHHEQHVTPEFFYQCLHRDKVDVDASLQPEGMRSKLLHYQLETVQWVLEKERAWAASDKKTGHDNAKSAADQGSWKHVPARGREWMVDFVGLHLGNRDDVERQLEDPEVQSVEAREEGSSGAAGGRGLIADEMGLGKTVEVLAVILNNPRPVMPPKLVYDTYSDREVLPCHTTLILCPSSIAQQWLNEVHRHAPGLKVWHYEGRQCKRLGEAVSEWIIDSSEALGFEDGIRVSKKSLFLSQFDIVICSYEVASREVANALYNPLRGRVTRNKLKSQSRAASSPITMLEDDIESRLELQSSLSQLQFWRVLLDEVQMVGNSVSNAAVVSRIIPRVHAWGVSGTLIRKGMVDLQGSLTFLRLSPWASEGGLDSKAAHAKHWEMLLRDCFRFEKVVRDVAIRHTKRQVRDQLVLPPQTRQHVRLNFNLVEEENYRHLFETMCYAVGATRDVSSATNGTNGASELRASGEGPATSSSSGIDDYKRPTNTSKTDPSVLSSWLLRLRQTCCHPRVGAGNKKALGNGLLRTVSEVLSGMYDQASAAVLNDERSLFVEYTEKAKCYEMLKDPAAALAVLEGQVGEVKARVEELREKAVVQQRRYRNVKAKLVGEWRKSEGRVKVEEEGDVQKVKVEDGEEVKEVKEGVKDEKDVKEDAKGAEEDEKDEKDEKDENEVKEDTRESTELDSDSDSDSDSDNRFLTKFLKQSEELSSEKEKKLALLHRYRSWVDLLHRFYFFIGTFYFQVGASERESKETSASVEAETKEAPEAVKVEEELSFHQKMETENYEKAESLRHELLQKPLHRVSTDVARLKHAKSLDLHEIDVSTLESHLGLESRFSYDSITTLVKFTNRQSEFLQEWMQEVVKLLTAEEEPKSETESETDQYATSLDNQHVISDYIDAITHLLQLREDTLQIKVNSASSIVLMWYDKGYKGELSDVQKDLRQKLDSCHVWTHMGTLRGVLAGLKTGGASNGSRQQLEQDSSAELIRKFGHIVREVSGMTKKCHSRLSLIRHCFNSKVVYYKQLQQLSDNVSSMEETSTVLLVDLLHKIDVRIERLSPVIQRQKGRMKYLEGLQDTGTAKTADRICVICQDYITIGSLTVCGHYFCKQCLEEWWATRHLCPICQNVLGRQDVFSFSQGDAKTAGQSDGQFAAHLPSDDPIRALYEPTKPELTTALNSIKIGSSSASSYGTKVDFVVRYIKHLQLLDSSVQIVVFSQWTEILGLLGQALGENSIKYAEPKTLMSFLTDDSVTCFLLNAKHQSTGLTLVNATHVILCEPILNAAIEAQAVSRIHRIGQTKPTHVTIFTMADTVEEQVLRLSAEKRLKSLAATDDTMDELDSRQVTSGGIKTDKSGEVVDVEDVWDALFPR